MRRSSAPTYDAVNELLNREDLDVAVLEWAAASLLTSLVSERSDLEEIRPNGRQGPAVINAKRAAPHGPFRNAYWEKYVKGTREESRIPSAEDLTAAALERHLADNPAISLALSSHESSPTNAEFRVAQRDVVARMLKFNAPLQSGRIEKVFGLPVRADPRLINADQMLLTRGGADSGRLSQLARDVAHELAQLPSDRVRTLATQQAEQHLRAKFGDAVASQFAKELEIAARKH
jgi:hypothetical protein